MGTMQPSPRNYRISEESALEAWRAVAVAHQEIHWQGASGALSPVRSRHWQC